MTRFTMRVQLDNESRDALVSLCDRTGMTQIAVMSRLMKWFASQNEVIQARVLGGLSDQTIADLSRQLLEQMADKRSTRESEGAGRRG